MAVLIFFPPEVDFQNKIQLEKLQKVEIETKHFASFICFPGISLTWKG